MRRALLLIAVGLFFLHEPVAQVKATQSTDEAENEREDRAEKPVTEFKSPMVLEIPAAKLIESSFYGNTWRSEELGDYFCEDVSISRFTMYWKRKKNPSPQISFYTKLNYYTRPPVDKLVRVRIELMSGQERAVAWRGLEFETDEGKVREHGFESPYFPLSDIEAAFSAKEPPHLRFTIWVKDEEKKSRP